MPNLPTVDRMPECPHCGGPVSTDTYGRAGSHRVWRIGSDGLPGPSRDRREAACPGAGQPAVLASAPAPGRIDHDVLHRRAPRCSPPGSGSCVRHWTGQTAAGARLSYRWIRAGNAGPPEAQPVRD